MDSWRVGHRSLRRETTSVKSRRDRFALPITSWRADHTLGCPHHPLMFLRSKRAIKRSPITKGYRKKIKPTHSIPRAVLRDLPARRWPGCGLLLPRSRADVRIDVAAVSQTSSRPSIRARIVIGRLRQRACPCRQEARQWRLSPFRGTRSRPL